MAAVDALPSRQQKLLRGTVPRPFQLWSETIKETAPIWRGHRRCLHRSLPRSRCPNRASAVSLRGSDPNSAAPGPVRQLVCLCSGTTSLGHRPQVPLGASGICTHCSSMRWRHDSTLPSHLIATRFYRRDHSAILCAGSEGDSISSTFQPSLGDMGPCANLACKIPFLVVDLLPGDALFLPAGWWHQVEAYPHRHHVPRPLQVTRKRRKGASSVVGLQDEGRRKQQTNDEKRRQRTDGQVPGANNLFSSAINWYFPPLSQINRQRTGTLKTGEGHVSLSPNRE